VQPADGRSLHLITVGNKAEGCHCGQLIRASNAYRLTSATNRVGRACDTERSNAFALMLVGRCQHLRNNVGFGTVERSLYLAVYVLNRSHGSQRCQVNIIIMISYAGHRRYKHEHPQSHSRRLCSFLSCAVPPPVESRSVQTLAAYWMRGVLLVGSNTTYVEPKKLAPSMPADPALACTLAVHATTPHLSFQTCELSQR
jgi:hypothetical protein